jgi:predicted amidohydrolase
MRLSVIQPDLEWENKSVNLLKLGKLLSSLNGITDLVILPEMFNTGFSMKTDHLSEPPDGETYNWMKELSRKGGFGLCGSYIVKEETKVYNRWVFVSPGEERSIYNKRHPFSMGGEDKLFTPGKSRLVFRFRGVRISPYICYDLRFPVWSRNKNDVDLLIYAANWPAGRKNVWNILLRARAIENQCFVAGSNRIGTDGNGIYYSGESMIIDPRGEIIASAESDLEQCITSEISMDELSDFRQKFPVLEDSDSFIINP